MIWIYVSIYSKILFTIHKEKVPYVANPFLVMGRGCYKFCTWHDNTIAVWFVKYCIHHFLRTWMRWNKIGIGSWWQWNILVKWTLCTQNVFHVCFQFQTIEYHYWISRYLSVQYFYFHRCACLSYLMQDLGLFHQNCILIYWWGTVIFL